MPGHANGFSLAYTATGAVVLWSGIKGWTISQTFRQLLSGKTPSGSSEPISTAVAASSSSATSVPVTATGNTIADDAQKYAGHPYLYGGAPGSDGSRPWDCSSFCNWVLGHDLGMILPGQSSPGYSGTSHGPNTVLYLAWSRAQTVGHSPSAAQAGDLCVWQTHMGIALGGGQMISALNQSLGTRVTTIEGGSPGGEVLFVRRVVIGNQRS